jgi:ribonuclease HI
MARKRRAAIVVHTDGSCRGNPGPAGIGVVLASGDRRLEISEYIGEATSNVAELTAIIRGLAAIKDRTRYVIVRSDSEYAITALSGQPQIRANRELIDLGRQLVATFARLRFEWVPAHAGIADNERCDQLAKQAVEDGAAKRESA